MSFYRLLPGKILRACIEILAWGQIKNAYINFSVFKKYPLQTTFLVAWSPFIWMLWWNSNMNSKIYNLENSWGPIEMSRVRNQTEIYIVSLHSTSLTTLLQKQTQDIAGSLVRAFCYCFRFWFVNDIKIWQSGSHCLLCCMLWMQVNNSMFKLW